MTRNASMFKAFFPLLEQANQSKSKEESTIMTVRQGFVEDEITGSREGAVFHRLGFFEVSHPSTTQAHLA